jgi:hypothetical protein
LKDIFENNLLIFESKRLHHVSRNIFRRCEAYYKLEDGTSRLSYGIKYSEIHSRSPQLRRFPT